MSNKKTVKEYLADPNTKSWNIGQIKKVQGQNGEFSKFVLNPNTEIYVEGVKVPIKMFKDKIEASLFKIDEDRKHENLKKAEAQYNFRLTHDIVVKLDRD